MQNEEEMQEYMKKFFNFLSSRGVRKIGAAQYRLAGGRVVRSAAKVLKDIDWPKCAAYGDADIKDIALNLLSKDLHITLPTFWMETKWDIVRTTILNDSLSDLAASSKSLEDYIKNNIIFISNLESTGSHKDAILAIDTQTRSIFRGNIETLMRIKKEVSGDKATAAPLSAIVRFNPYTTDLLFHTEWNGIPVTAVNLYSPPSWHRYALENNISPNFPEEFKVLIDHLFIDPIEREQVLDWCANAITSRNETALVLAGFKGTGKNVFMATIMGNIIGHDYTEIVGQATLDEKFNAAFYNKRLVIFDEVTLTSTTAIDNFKRYCNSRIAIEKKGIDAFTATNFSSIAILSNNVGSLGITMSDRRFSVPAIAKRRLEDAFAEKGLSLQEMIDGIEANTEKWKRKIAEFGMFLLKRNPPASSRTRQIAGEYFAQVAEASTPDWVLYLVDYVGINGIEGTPVIVKEVLRTEYKEELKTIRKKGIQRYLSEHFYKMKYPIGKIENVKDEKGRVAIGLMPNKQFLEEYRRDKNLPEPKPNLTLEEKMKMMKELLYGPQKLKKEEENMADEDLL